MHCGGGDDGSLRSAEVRRIAQPKILQVGHSPEVHQPSIGDFGTSEIERTQFGECAEMTQSSVGDLRTVKVERL